MKLTLTTVFLLAVTTNGAFMPGVPSARTTAASKTVVKGYLDDLSNELYAPDNNPDLESESKEKTDMKKEQVDRYGAGSFEDYVEFDEFDGGDGQMGVAGDGQKGLEKIGGFSAPSLLKSKTMSAKNAWGTSSGYADELIEKGMDSQKAQRLENWQNQQEVRRKQLSTKEMLESFDEQQTSSELDWRELAHFGVERNQEFDMNEEFGPVVPGADVETVELHTMLNRVTIHEFKLKNEYMGFADFRAAFTADTDPVDWKVEPNEGALKSSEATDFIVRFRPQNPGVSYATLVIDTEDMKKTWRFIGSTA